MKYGLLQISLFLFLCSNAWGQQYSIVEKVSKKCNVVANEELYGLEVNKKLVQQPQFSDYEAWNGLICFHSESGSACWNSAGQKILEFNDAQLSTGETNYYIFATRGETEQALFDLTGKEILPFGKYEFDFYEHGLIVKRKDGNQAFYDTKGKAILPFSPKPIEVVDDYDLVLGLNETNYTRFLLNETIEPQGSFSKVDDFTFVLDHEVTIEEYAYFLISQAYNGYLNDSTNTVTIEWKDLLPDTTKVEAKVLPFYRKLFRSFMDPEAGGEEELTGYLPGGESIDLYTNFKFDKELKALSKYPVTGITKEQAEYFCKWLGIMGQEYGDEAGYGAYPVYRLPSPKEWEMIAEQGLRTDRKEPGAPDSLSVQNCITFIYSTKNQCKNYASYLKASKGGGTVPAESIPLDMKGRYQFFGNVAEMTNQKGVSKGGSYMHPAKEANLKNTIKYSAPQPWLGFRIIGEYHY